MIVQSNSLWIINNVLSYCMFCHLSSQQLTFLGVTEVDFLPSLSLYKSLLRACFAFLCALLPDIPPVVPQLFVKSRWWGACWTLCKLSVISVKFVSWKTKAFLKSQMLIIECLVGQWKYHINNSTFLWIIYSLLLFLIELNSV